MKDLADYDWQAAEQSLNHKGHAVLPELLDKAECDALIALYDDDARFRSHIHMARHGFGRGEYKYFHYPLPDLVVQVREGAYPHLGLIANRWAERLNQEKRFPETLATFLAQCHDAGQRRPTPLLLQYGPGDHNALHQDLYGEAVFPLQIIVALNERGVDYTGGELMLVEQRPRMQSIGRVLTPRRGDAVIIAVNHRPRHGTKGDYRVAQRHGVSEVLDGRRHTLGVIFHDAA